MQYIVSKKEYDYEYRVYSSDNSEGNIIFKGHKLSIETSVLSEIIDYKYDKSTNRYLFPNYKILYQEHNGSFPNNVNNIIWNAKDILDSWYSILQLLNKTNKVTITKVNTY